MKREFFASFGNKIILFFYFCIRNLLFVQRLNNQKMNNETIRFIDPDKNTAQFFSELRKRVDEYFREKKLSRHFNSEMVLKTIILLSAYVLPFAALLIFPLPFSVSLLLWIVMAFALAGIGMSVMHDANHGAYSKNSRVNYWLGHTLNLLGGSVFNWKMQHNLQHHTFTNIVNEDDDIADKLILRFSPHTEVKWYHKLQFVYAFLFYGIVTLYWAFLKDFLQFRSYIRDGVNKNNKQQNRVALLKLIFIKIAYSLVFIVLPLFVVKVPAGQWLYGFLLMHFIAGIVLTVIFQLAHTVEGTTHPLPNENYVIENNWAIHQLHTTVNFARKNKVLTWYLGGLNYQVEHHLFPTICHVHYPAISGIVKSTCEEYGVPYLENETFAQALLSHIRTLQRFGKMTSLNEVIA
jgi:linoleoyl-CoA desaturase